MVGSGWGWGEVGGAVRRGGKMTAGQKKCHTDLDQQVLSNADPVAGLLPHSFSGWVSCRLPLPF